MKIGNYRHFIDESCSERFVEWFSIKHVLNLIVVTAAKGLNCLRNISSQLPRSYSCSCAFVAMATYSFHRLIMEKVKIGLLFMLFDELERFLGEIETDNFTVSNNENTTFGFSLFGTTFSSSIL